MAKMTRSEWEDEIHRSALSAAEAWRKYVGKNYGARISEEAEKAQYEKIFNFLVDKYPYDSVSNEDMEDMGNLSSDAVWKWTTYGDAYDARKRQESAELSKYLPYLHGVAPEGEDWYSRNDLKLKGTDDFGFEYSREGLAKFLDKLAKYQGIYDRGEIMKELRAQPWYWPTRISYPSMMEGVENAISTGSDFSGADMAKLGLLDAGINAGMFAMPGFSEEATGRFLGNAMGPVKAGVSDALLQGFLEGGRQSMKTMVDPTLEADPRQAVAATLFGASRPGIVGSLQAGVSRIPGKEAMAISRGISKSTRAGNPVANEREALKEMFTNHNRLVEDFSSKVSKGNPYVEFLDDGTVISVNPSGGTLVNRSVADTEKMLSMQKVKEMADYFGIRPKASGKYDVEEFLKAYDKKPVYTWDLTNNTAKLTTPVKGLKSSENLFQLTPENSQQYRALFPAKYSDEAGASRMRSLGLGLGKLAGDFGGRFEPTFKLNPFNAGPQNFQKYNEQDWYTRLGPKSRAIIDEAFKRQAKELDEDEKKRILEEQLGL